MANKEYTGPMILVAVGKVQLTEAMKWVGTDREDELGFLLKSGPPVYRRPMICTTEEVTAHTDYLNWLMQAFQLEADGRPIEQ